MSDIGEPIAAFAVEHQGKIVVATTYETEGLSKYHWLAYCSGDYLDEDFFDRPGRLDWNVEFDKYPDAKVVPVNVHTLEKS